MRIPTGAIVPLFLASFLMLAFQYFHVSPERRVLNLRFGLMAGAIVLMVATVFLGDLSIAPVFFLLGLFWLGAALYLLRLLPPSRH